MCGMQQRYLGRGSSGNAACNHVKWPNKRRALLCHLKSQTSLTSIACLMKTANQEWPTCFAKYIFFFFNVILTIHLARNIMRPRWHHVQTTPDMTLILLIILSSSCNPLSRPTILLIIQKIGKKEKTVRIIYQIKITRNSLKSWAGNKWVRNKYKLFPVTQSSEASRRPHTTPRLRLLYPALNPTPVFTKATADYILSLSYPLTHSLFPTFIFKIISLLRLLDLPPSTATWMATFLPSLFVVPFPSRQCLFAYQQHTIATVLKLMSPHPHLPNFLCYYYMTFWSLPSDQ